MQRYASSAASVVIGAAFAAVAFGAKGGSVLSSLTWVEIAVVIVGALLVAAAVVHGRKDQLDGGSALMAFVALAALTTLSVLWSIAPDLTWIEANRTLTYLVVFAAGIALARLAPGSWSVLLKGLLLAATAIVGYALASRVWPGSLAANEIYARIGQPYGYWNAVGVTAALAIPPAVWLGARRSGHAPANALAYPLLGMLIVALFLSYSRGALAAAIVGLIVWFAFVPLRVRSLAVLGVSVIGAVPVILWALSRDAFTKDLVPLSVRESAAGEFGLLLITMVAVLLAAGLLIGFRREPRGTLAADPPARGARGGHVRVPRAARGVHVRGVQPARPHRHDLRPASTTSQARPPPPPAAHSASRRPPPRAGATGATPGTSSRRIRWTAPAPARSARRGCATARTCWWRVTRTASSPRRWPTWASSGCWSCSRSRAHGWPRCSGPRAGGCASGGHAQAGPLPGMPSVWA